MNEGFKNLISILTGAINEEKSIKIIYYGGSIPGSVREIIPSEIDGDRVLAFCTASGMNKTFLLHKIKLAASDAPITYSIENIKNVKNIRTYDSIDDISLLTYHERDGGW